MFSKSHQTGNYPVPISILTKVLNRYPLYKNYLNYQVNDCNKRPIGHIAHLRNIPSNEQARGKAIISQAGCSKLAKPILGQNCMIPYIKKEF